MFTGFDLTTKIEAQEEVAVGYSEIVTDFSVNSIQAVEVDSYKLITDSGIELDLGDYNIHPGLNKAESEPFIKDC